MSPMMRELGSMGAPEGFHPGLRIGFQIIQLGWTIGGVKSRIGCSATSRSDSESDGYPKWLNRLRGIPCSKAACVRVCIVRGGTDAIGSISKDASGNCSGRNESRDTSDVISSLLSSTDGSAKMATFWSNPKS